MNKKFINRLEKVFLNKIGKQTNWGKNQIAVAFKESIAQVALEYIDDLETTPEEKLAKLPYNPLSNIAKYKAAKGETDISWDKDIRESRSEIADAENWFLGATEQDHTKYDDEPPEDAPPF